MNKKALFSGLSDALLKKIKKTKQPTFIQPMLATLTEDYFSSNDWLYEHKFDGERCLAFKKKGKVYLVSRNNKEMNTSYPELVKSFMRQKADNFILDGEIIAEKKGVSDFELLQGRMNLQALENIKIKEQEVPIVYCIFDLMYVDGYDIRNLPLHARKTILKKLLNYNTMLTYTEHKIGNGIALFKKACKLHWEGLIAKRIDSPYVGKRSRDWLKFKCISKQELVIGGYTNPKGSRTYFGALLVGYYKDGKLHYAGKVGTGFSEETLTMLGTALKKLTIKKSPFSDYTLSEKNVNWVKPKLVAEFQFAQWTRGGEITRRAL